MSRAQHSNDGGDALGMLVWRLPVRFVEVSRSGCLVEATRHLDVGTNGQLHIEMNGVLHVDDVRVCRCQVREGSSRVHHVGMELLRTRRLTRRSLRLAMRRLIGEQREAATVVSEEHDPAIDGRQERRERGVTRSPPAAVAADT